MKHPNHIPGFEGSIDELVKAIGITKYDVAVEFLAKLGDEYKLQGDGDLKRGRVKLASKLYETANRLYAARDKMKETWELCKPYMDNRDI